MSTDPKSTYYDHGGIETVEILRAKLFPEQLEGYLLGNIIKYASRLNYKGDPQRDSEKLVIYATLLRDVMCEHDQSASETRDPQLHDGEPIDASGQEQVRERHDIKPDPTGQLGDYGACGVDDADPLTRLLPEGAGRPVDGRPSIHNCPSGANCRNGCGLGPCPMESNE